ncbi:hypothetical protein, partial [Salmonella sp. s51228]|uniref:hypothetical protein n=1 Tax=Salmonella sp. s51228 TaxID=3159652 RepID=UPI0039804790
MDNAPSKFRKYTHKKEINAHDTESLSTSIASKSILPLPEESSIASTHSVEELMEILGTESLSSNFLNFSEKQQVPNRLHYISSQNKRRSKGFIFKDSND